MTKEVGMFPVEYEVEVYNDMNGNMETLHGITFADSYTEAMDKIENFYGDDINMITITLLEENTVYEFEHTVDNFSHGMYKINKFSKW